MAYTKTNWVNDSVPAINASNLNKIEQGIYDNAFESGSNANGNYIKFNDGTLIQWGKVNKSVTLSNLSQGTQWYYEDGYKINLPVSFIDNNFFANVSNYYNGNITLNIYSITGRSASSFEFNLSCSVAVTNANAEFGWFAIGRWK